MAMAASIESIIVVDTYCQTVSLSIIYKLE